MNSNYHRVLHKIKCVGCGHETYDAYVEEIIWDDVPSDSSGLKRTARIEYHCPKCQCIDSFKKIEDDDILEK